jgi:hypothetical protein
MQPIRPIGSCSVSHGTSHSASPDYHCESDETNREPMSYRGRNDNSDQRERDIAALNIVLPR